jgi:hypothetical protein
MIFYPAYYLINILNTHYPYCITAAVLPTGRNIGHRTQKVRNVSGQTPYEADFAAGNRPKFIYHYLIYFLQIRLLALFSNVFRILP